jgi:predicted nuclease of predicted toxin-antitoxin system
MIKFLFDESVGRKVFDHFFDLGFNAKFVSHLMPRAEDEEVLELAEKEGRILVTNDKDFGELIFLLNKPSSGVVLLRLTKDIPEIRKKYLLYLINNFSDRLADHFIVVSEGSVRFRKIER